MASTEPLLCPEGLLLQDHRTDIETHILNRSSPEHPEPLQELPDHYTIEGLLGKGGMSQVHHALDLRHDPPQDVALKRVNYDLSGEPRAKSKEALTHEGHILSTLRGIEGIIGLREHYSDALILDYVNGRPLQSLMKYPPADAKALGQRCRHLASATQSLAEVHARGIVHRDIKPENILVTFDGEPVIIDFGISRYSSNSTSSNNDFDGTAIYSAPEQIQGQGLTPASDIYSFGVSLYEAATGLHPRNGRTLQVIFYQSTQVRPPFTTHAPRVLVDLTMSALDIDPKNRPNAIEFSQALLDISDRLNPK